MSKTKAVAVAATLFMLNAYGSLAEQEWPEKEYSCQVVTSSGSQGIVGIQTTTLERAEAVVIGHDAITMLGQNEKAATVIQCVQKYVGERFKDSSFQAFAETLGG
ncbi:MAG: hypothetical protein HRT77_16650 [Halioglobus sp.]|nr:hypothetical protein [Halioglobus sp.]